MNKNNIRTIRCFMLTISILWLWTGVARAGELKVNISTYSVFSDEVTSTFGLMVNIDIPDELIGNEIDRALLVISPSTSDSSTALKSLACYQIISGWNAASATFTDESIQIDQYPLSIGNIGEVGESSDWRIDLSSALSECIENSESELKLFITGLLDPGLELGLDDDSEQVSPGKVGVLVVHYTRSEAIPMSDTE